MGNCCGTTSSSSVDHWGGEDWSFLTSSKNSRNRSSTKVFDELKLMNNKEDKLLVGDSNASSSSNGKIKIKISKKELQVLLGELEKQNKNKKKNTNNSAEQVLVRLMEARDQHHHLHPAGHNWSPALESIPEVN
ncbi:uncharacterized protein LOC114721309 [Neltuma alba]|uniref:uncharacterized protein LOC114721309 n=1 Tax=Neltuma alba TaxID=207710 RepID=UPI0010A33680|nr:uncharacterized protein LOC114721309 [Prosopis alba]